MLKGRMSLQNALLVAIKTLSSDIGLLHQVRTHHAKNMLLWDD
jgi:hypothetical protein